MANPILQLLNGNPKQSKIEAMYNNLLRNNPQFRQFVKENEGKSIQDIAMEYDLDLSILKNLIK